MKKYIAAIDEGTTSARAVLYEIAKHKIIKSKSVSISQIYPEPSYVEEDANEIYSAALSSLVEIIEYADSAEEIAGIGITNQRETVVAWDKKTGKPLYNAIVWQCRRTADYCEKLGEEHGEEIKEKTGLIVDSYFSASKIKWLIDNVPEVKAHLNSGNLCVGTMDTFLIYKLTNGKSFVTDCTNASRTMLYNIKTLRWDKDLLDIFGIPESILPRVIGCAEKAGDFTYNGKIIPIAGIAGDQQAALFGQCCFAEGSSKITYGTGLFMLYNIGGKPLKSKHGLLTTIAYSVGGKTVYAFEGSVFNAGSSIQWLRDNLGFFSSSAESEALALSVPDSGGVYMVPAFTGLGAPYWNSNARGIITGLTRGVTKAHITRATLEAMAYSAKDLADVMELDSGIALKEIRSDGGASVNNFLMQFQADLLNVIINRPKERESTSLGAVYLCGIASGSFEFEEVEKLRETDKKFIPDCNRKKYDELYRGWKNAVMRCING